MAHQARAVLVALVQDLDRDRTVLDLPAVRPVLAHADEAVGAVRAAVHEVPDLLGRRVHLERVAVFLHGALPPGPVVPRIIAHRTRSAHRPTW